MTHTWRKPAIQPDRDDALGRFIAGYENRVQIMEKVADSLKNGRRAAEHDLITSPEQAYIRSSRAAGLGAIFATATHPDRWFDAVKYHHISNRD